MSDPFNKEASKYNTAVRREKRRHQEATEREELNHSDRVLALRAALSPAAARIVVAAESETEPHPPLVMAMKEATVDVDPPDPNPAPDWLNKEPAPLPAGALLEVSERPSRKRA